MFFSSPNEKSLPSTTQIHSIQAYMYMLFVIYFEIVTFQDQPNLE